LTLGQESRCYRLCWWYLVCSLEPHRFWQQHWSQNNRLSYINLLLSHYYHYYLRISLAHNYLISILDYFIQASNYPVISFLDYISNVLLLQFKIYRVKKRKELYIRVNTRELNGVLSTKCLYYICGIILLLWNLLQLSV